MKYSNLLKCLQSDELHVRFNLPHYEGEENQEMIDKLWQVVFNYTDMISKSIAGLANDGYNDSENLKRLNDICSYSNMDKNTLVFTFESDVCPEINSEYFDDFIKKFQVDLEFDTEINNEIHHIRGCFCSLNLDKDIDEQLHKLNAMNVDAPLFMTHSFNQFRNKLESKGVVISNNLNENDEQVKTKALKF